MSEPSAENEVRLRKALADARVSVRDFDAILAAARVLRAETWDEAVHHVEPLLPPGVKRDAMLDNPYRPIPPGTP